jgi:hypothetical protein
MTARNQNVATTIKKLDLLLSLQFHVLASFVKGGTGAVSEEEDTYFADVILCKSKF